VTLTRIKITDSNKTKTAARKLQHHANNAIPPLGRIELARSWDPWPGMQGRINHCTICTMAGGPRRGGPRGHVSRFFCNNI